MSVESIQILLVASSNVALKGKVLRLLCGHEAAEFEKRKSTSAYQAEQVIFVSEELSNFVCDEPHEELANSISKKLINAAKWLNSLDQKVLSSLHKENIEFKVMVCAWLENGQFDLRLVPEFLSACGRLGLAIEVVTND